MIAPEVASKLLDDVVYERVLGCIDLDALFQFEQELWSIIGETENDDDKIGDLAKEMIDRAFARLPDEPRRYSVFHGPSDGFGDDCELCKQEARDNAAKGRRKRS